MEGQKTPILQVCNFLIIFQNIFPKIALQFYFTFGTNYRENTHFRKRKATFKPKLFTIYLSLQTEVSIYVQLPLCDKFGIIARPSVWNVSLWWWKGSLELVEAIK